MRQTLSLQNKTYENALQLPASQIPIAHLPFTRLYIKSRPSKQTRHSCGHYEVKGLLVRWRRAKQSHK